MDRLLGPSVASGATPSLQHDASGPRGRAVALEVGQVAVVAVDGILDGVELHL